MLNLISKLYLIMAVSLMPASSRIKTLQKISWVTETNDLMATLKSAFASLMIEISGKSWKKTLID